MGIATVAVLISAVVVLWTLFACATPYPGKSTQAAGAPVDGAPAVRVTWIDTPDLRTSISAIPWCADQHGRGGVYPCKWDSRERVVVGWDPQAAPIAVFVDRAVGCGPLIGNIKIAEDNSVAWGCYHAPGT